MVDILHTTTGEASKMCWCNLDRVVTLNMA